MAIMFGNIDLEDKRVNLTKINECVKCKKKVGATVFFCDECLVDFEEHANEFVEQRDAKRK